MILDLEKYSDILIKTMSMVTFVDEWEQFQTPIGVSVGYQYKTSSITISYCIRTGGTTFVFEYDNNHIVVYCNYYYANMAGNTSLVTFNVGTSPRTLRLLIDNIEIKNSVEDPEDEFVKIMLMI